MVIVIKEKDRVVVGYANSEWSYPYPSGDSKDLENIPVKHLKGEKGRLVAFTKAGFLSDLFRFDDDFLETPVTADDLKRDVAPMMKSVAEHFKRVDDEGVWQNAMVVVEGDKIYDVNTSFQVREILNFVCHGYNIELVESALDAMAGLPAEERIQKAVAYHAKSVGLTCPTIAIFDTASLDCKFLGV